MELYSLSFHHEPPTMLGGALELKSIYILD